MTIALNSLDFSVRKLGLVRKHVPRDGNSFFRCFADRVLGSQRKYAEIRNRLHHHCVASEKWPDFDSIFGCEDTLSDVLMMTAECLTVPIILFHQHPATAALTHDVYDYDATSDDYAVKPVCIAVYEFEQMLQFDLILTEDQILVDSCAQALAYEALYAGVFGMDQQAIETSLEEMLCDKRFVKLKQQRKLLTYRSDKESPLPPELSGLPPVPYRIAKALDPTCYRNVVMDLWLQEVKKDTDEVTDASTCHIPIGSRCWFPPDPRDPSRRLICFVASSQLHGFQVQVYVPSLRKKVKCDVRNLLVAEDRKRGRRQPSRSSPDSGRGSGNENWLHPDPSIINQHPAHHYPLPLNLPEYQPFLPTAAVPFPQYDPHLLAHLFHASQMMLMASYAPVSLFPGSIVSPVPGSVSSLESPCWSPSCCFLSPPVGDGRDVFQYLPN